MRPLILQKNKNRSPEGIVPPSVGSSTTKSVFFSLPSSSSHSFSLTFRLPTPVSSLCHSCAGRTSVCPETYQSCRHCLSPPTRGVSLFFFLPSCHSEFADHSPPSNFQRGQGCGLGGVRMRGVWKGYAHAFYTMFTGKHNNST